jgi:hypothetical protein
MAGAGIQQWMQTTGASLALARGRAEDESDRPRTAFLRTRAFSDLEDLRIEACLKRSEASCALIIADQEPSFGDLIDQVEERIVGAGIPLLESDYDQRRDDGGPATWYILDALEREFGAEAFGRFWRSDEPMTIAFQNAFGLSTASWGFQWASSLEGARADMNVLPSRRESGLMIIYTLVGLGLALGVATRRKVG